MPATEFFTRPALTGRSGRLNLVAVAGGRIIATADALADRPGIAYIVADTPAVAAGLMDSIHAFSEPVYGAGEQSWTGELAPQVRAVA